MTNHPNYLVNLIKHKYASGELVDDLRKAGLTIIPVEPSDEDVERVAEAIANPALFSSHIHKEHFRRMAKAAYRTIAGGHDE